MTNIPKVTVRMSAYNHERYVEQAIRSILDQTFQDFELIVIDDGSSDSTPEIIQRLSDAHGFYFERQQNQGLTPTLNKLNAMARGEYLTGCASDDFWPPNRLEEQVRTLDENPEVDFVLGNLTGVDAAGNIEAKRRFRIEQMIDGDNAFEDLIWLRKSFQTTTHMMRRAVWEELGGYDESIPVEDVDWMLRVTRNYNVKAIDKVWTYYRKHGENWTMSKAGAMKLIRSEQMVACKLGLRWGLPFVFRRVPSWLLICRRSSHPKRFLYLFFIVFYFWHRGFVRDFFAILLGSKMAAKRKQAQSEVRKRESRHV